MTWRNSSSVSDPGLCSTASRIPILPMSCSSPPIRIVSRAAASNPSSLRGRDGILAHPDRVTPGVGVLGLERAREHLHAFQKQLLDPLGLGVHLLLEMRLVVAVLHDQRPLLHHPHDARVHLLHRDRLQQEIGGAELERVYRGAGLGHAAEHDHRGVGPAAPHLGEEAHAVELGHAKIGDDEGELAGLVEGLESFLARGGLEAGEAERLEHADDGAADQRLVVHHETARGAGRKGHPVVVRAGTPCKVDDPDRSSTSRTLEARVSGENGLARNGAPGSSSPRRMISSLV